MDKFASPWDNSSRSSKLNKPMSLLSKGGGKTICLSICANRQQVDAATFNVRGYFEVQIKKKEKKKSSLVPVKTLRASSFASSSTQHCECVNARSWLVVFRDALAKCYQRSGTGVLSPRRRLSSTHNRNSWLMFGHTSDVAGGVRAAL